VVASELDGRRWADALARGGVRSVSCYRDGSDLPSDGTPLDVVVISATRGAAVVDVPSGAFGGIPTVLVAASFARGTVDEALAAAVRGVVAEEHVEERLVATVLAVAAGQLVIPSEARGALERPLLTPREKQVMSMIVLGFSNREIANKLFLAETTVKSHVSSAYRKLQVRTRQEAAAMILDGNHGFGLGVLSISYEPERALH
jgi:DNA-binding NarL/FixJ family response regulator